jgi:hypothetical protein
MDLRLGALLLWCVACPAGAGGPIAEVICAPRDEMVLRLEKGQGAQLRGMGMRSEDAVIEVWADEKGDWTLVQNWADGPSCILAMGEGWQGMDLPPA